VTDHWGICRTRGPPGSGPGLRFPGRVVLSRGGQGPPPGQKFSTGGRRGPNYVAPFWDPIPKGATVPARTATGGLVGGGGRSFERCEKRAGRVVGLAARTPDSAKDRALRLAGIGGTARRLDGHRRCHSIPGTRAGAARRWTAPEGKGKISSRGPDENCACREGGFPAIPIRAGSKSIASLIQANRDPGGIDGEGGGPRKGTGR